MAFSNEQQRKHGDQHAALWNSRDGLGRRLESGGSGARDRVRFKTGVWLQFEEFRCSNLTKINIAHTSALLEKAKLKGAVSLGLPPEADVSSEDLAQVKRGSAILAKALHATAALKGDYLGGVIYSALRKFARAPSIAGRANAVTVIPIGARGAQIQRQYWVRGRQSLRDQFAQYRGAGVALYR